LSHYLSELSNGGLGCNGCESCRMCFILALPSTTKIFGYCTTVNGTVNELNKRGTLTLLPGFTGSDGEYPAGGVIRVRGNLYGTARRGGSGG